MPLRIVGESSRSLKTCYINNVECNIRFMDETILDWDDMRLFLAVAHHGGLAAAAEASGKSAPTLGRRMLALERRLGQELFERLPRGYELTDDGRVLMGVAQHIQGSIDPVLAAANSVNARRVKISAGTWTTYLLCQHVKRIVADDSVTLQFIAADHLLDIPHREAVIGIRNQRPKQISLAGQRINKVRFAVYARDKSVSSWVQVIGSTPSARWVSENRGDAACIEVSHPRNALDLAITGDAKVVLPSFIGDATDGLVRVSDEIEALEHMQWLVTHQEDRHLPEVRRVIDRIHALLSGGS